MLVIILDSARKHGISDFDMLGIVYDPYIVVEIRPEPRKHYFWDLIIKQDPLR